MKRFFCLLLIFSFMFGSCNVPVESSAGETSTSTVTQSDVYESEPISVVSNSQGEVSIKSENSDVTYQVQINDGIDSIEGYIIEYVENGSKSIIHGYDPLNRYGSFIISGTPDYIMEYFASSSMQSRSLDNGTEIESRVLIAGTIALVITVAALYTAQISFLLNAAKVQSFYYKNVVDYYDGGLVLETTFDELASDYIVPRYNGIMDLVDIGFTFVTAGVGACGKATLYTVATDFAVGQVQSKVEQLRDELVSIAITEWGMTMQEAVDSKIFVVIELDERDNGFQKMYASYKIYLEDPTWDETFFDSFENQSDGDKPDGSVWTLTEMGGSDISVISSDATDGIRSVEFNDGVSEDACYMVGSLNGLTKGWMTWDWKVKNPGAFGFQTWSGGSSYNWDNVNFYISFSSNGWLKYNNSHDTLEESIFEYSEDDWYSMKVYFDCDSDYIDLYVNGVKRLRQHDFWHDTSQIDYFRFIAFTNQTIQGAVVDNIRISSDSPSVNRGGLGVDVSSSVSIGNYSDFEGDCR